MKRPSRRGKKLSWPFLHISSWPIFERPDYNPGPDRLWPGGSIFGSARRFPEQQKDDRHSGFSRGLNFACRRVKQRRCSIFFVVFFPQPRRLSSLSGWVWPMKKNGRRNRFDFVRRYFKHYIGQINSQPFDGKFWLQCCRFPGFRAHGRSWTGLAIPAPQ